MSRKRRDMWLTVVDVALLLGVLALVLAVLYAWPTHLN